MTGSSSQPKSKLALRRFRELGERLPGLLQSLLTANPHHRDKRPAAPKVPAVYLFTENGNHRYVGRTRNANRRFGEHTRPSSPQNSAPFAFNIAKRDAVRDGLVLHGTRKAIAADPAFKPYFTAAKQRVRAMEFRFVEIDDPVLSTVFEVYVALALSTEGEFNLFDTH